MDFLEDLDKNKFKPDIQPINIDVNLKRKKLELLKLQGDDEIDECSDTKKKKLSYSNPSDSLEYKNLNVENCVHEVVYPKNFDYQPLKPRLSEPVKEFSFTLDAFQNQAIQCIENNQSVLVAAHTSAGKTVSALYAIAQCIKENKKAIYTTPIKALSNQKYREFKEAFGDVGLLTGDVSINDSSNVLIMTTEILRMMLYKNNSVIKEVGWIIFDEIHYMRDPSRGFVWEECIIQLKSWHRMLFLSATIPNARQFAEWISYTHSQPCNVIYTDYRPTPLEHHISIDNSPLFRIVDDKGVYYKEEFEKAMIALGNSEEENKGCEVKSIKNFRQKSHLEKLIRKIQIIKAYPVIVFSFSKKQCGHYAKSLSKLDFTSQEEKELIESVFDKAIQTLPTEDQNLPQLNSLLNLLKLGVGIHHSGLMPLLKEIVEILFGEGLIKCLIATETFAMGVNMPAKTVVFTSCTKYDGVVQRLLTPSEYIQMSGRAGRRGLDEQGNVIIMVEQSLKEEDVISLFKGHSEPLNSSFHLTYNMILNLTRVETVTPEFLMDHSFLRFQALNALPEIDKTIKNSKEKLDNILLTLDQRNNIEEYLKLEANFEQFQENLWSEIRQQNLHLALIKPGRIMRIKHNNKDFRFCVALDYVSSKKTVECLLPVVPWRADASTLMNAVPAKLNCKCPDGAVIEVDLNYIFEVYDEILPNIAKNINDIRNNVKFRRELFKLLNKRCEVKGRLKVIKMSEFVRKLTGKELSDSIKEKEQLVEGNENLLKLHNMYSNANKLDLIEHFNLLNDYNEREIEEYLKIEDEHIDLLINVWSKIRTNQNYQDFIIPGRLVQVKTDEKYFGWCVALTKVISNYSDSYVECLIPVDEKSLFARNLFQANPPRKSMTKPDGIILDVPLSLIYGLSREILPNVDKNVRFIRTKRKLQQVQLYQINALKHKHGEISTLILSEEIMKLKGLSKYGRNVNNNILKRERSVNEFLSRLNKQKLSQKNNKLDLIEYYWKLKDYREEFEALQINFRETEALVNLEELKCRKRILRRLKYVSNVDTIELKGQLACEINTSDELMLTEMMMNGKFLNLTVPQLCGLMTCFVFDEEVRTYDEPRDDLTDILKDLTQQAEMLVDLSVECGLKHPVFCVKEKYVASFKQGLVEIGRAWANGCSFRDLMTNKLLHDGSVIRCLRRTDELLGQLMDAAHAIGNQQMTDIFQQCSKAIHRGIVFSASLYLDTGDN